MDVRLSEQQRLLRLNQIVGQEEVTQDEAQANRAKVADLKKEWPPLSADPKIRKKQMKEFAKRLAKIGSRRVRPRIKPLIPVSSSSWWAGVASGKYPQPIRIGRVTCWRESEINALMERK